jgi:riboflavin biosynthesis pyrimidine reductase
MGSRRESGARGAPQERAKLRRLLPPGDPATAEQIVDQLGAAAPADGARPRVLLNMISTVDGRASIGGRSGPLSNQADRELFHALRAGVDAVMVGAGTARSERYGRIIRDADVRRLRLEHGRSEEPLACLVSGQLDLPVDLPLLATPAARVAIITPSQASISGAAAQLEYVRAERGGKLDLARALAELKQRFAVRSLLCEGGPHLNSHLLAAGLVDELLLSLSPKLAGADRAGGEALGIVAGAQLEAPVELELVAVLASDSHLFLRYAVGA